jgi:hypothetical protein
MISILTGTPKQLEIAVNHRKQNMGVVSNRDTKRGCFRHFSRGAGILPAALALRFPTPGDGAIL